MNNSNQRKQKLKIAYFGSPNFSASLLQLLLDDADNLSIEIKFVVTQPDRPAGRKLVHKPTPVKSLAQQARLAVFDQPLKTNFSVISEIMVEKKIDLAILFAFNEIIPLELLAKPRYGFWNVHPSLLPRYRGPSPIAYPLILGDKTTGVTLMQMDTKMDTGDVIGQMQFPIEVNDTHQTILDKTPHLAFNLIKQHLEFLGQETCAKQDNIEATYTRKLRREDGYISILALKQLLQNKTVALDTIPLIQEYFDKHPSYTPPEYMSIVHLYQLWQGLYPWPGIWTTIQTRDGEKRLKIVEMRVVDGTPTITQVQWEGRNAVSLKQLQENYPGFL